MVEVVDDDHEFRAGPPAAVAQHLRAQRGDVDRDPLAQHPRPAGQFFGEGRRGAVARHTEQPAAPVGDEQFHTPLLPCTGIGEPGNDGAQRGRHPGPCLTDDSEMCGGRRVPGHGTEGGTTDTEDDLARLRHTGRGAGDLFRQQLHVQVRFVAGHTDPPGVLDSLLVGTGGLDMASCRGDAAPRHVGEAALGVAEGGVRGRHLQFDGPGEQVTQTGPEGPAQRGDDHVDATLQSPGRQGREPTVVLTQGVHPVDEQNAVGDTGRSVLLQLIEQPVDPVGADDRGDLRQPRQGGQGATGVENVDRHRGTGQCESDGEGAEQGGLAGAR